MLERAGIPAVPVITSVFEGTANEMARLWGLTGFRFIMMPHPLANLAPEALAERADALVGPVVTLLRRGQVA